MKVLELKVDQIESFDNSREREGDVHDLMASIKSNGLLQPIGVWPKEDNPSAYFVVYGHRRLEAVRKLGWEKIDCIITQVGKDQDYYITNLTENVARRDVGLSEQARVIETLIENYNMSPDEVASRLGMTGGQIRTIRKAMREVPKEYRAKVHNKTGMRPDGEGHIPLSTAILLKNIARSQGLDKESTLKIFGAAEKGNITSKNAGKVGALLKAGSSVSEAIRKATKIKVIRLDLPIGEEEIERIKKTFGNSYKELMLNAIYDNPKFSLERP